MPIPIGSYLAKGQPGFQQGQQSGQVLGRHRKEKTSISKSISFLAGGTNSNQILVEANDNHLMLDNGDGTLSRANGGTGYIDYDEGGTVDLYNCPANAEFHAYFHYDAAHSGEISSHATTGNIMYEVYARSVTRGKQGSIKLTAFSIFLLPLVTLNNSTLFFLAVLLRRAKCVSIFVGSIPCLIAKNFL